MGAALAELKDAAIGQRIRVLWPAMQNKFFAATVTSFDTQAGTFRLDYDDGDVDAAFKPGTNTYVSFDRMTVMAVIMMKTTTKMTLSRRVVVLICRHHRSRRALCARMQKAKWSRLVLLFEMSVEAAAM